jgi:hypothetical protein
MKQKGYDFELKNIGVKTLSGRFLNPDTDNFTLSPADKKSHQSNNIHLDVEIFLNPNPEKENFITCGSYGDFVVLKGERRGNVLVSRVRFFTNGERPAENVEVGVKESNR